MKPLIVLSSSFSNCVTCRLLFDSFQTTPSTPTPMPTTTTSEQATASTAGSATTSTTAGSTTPTTGTLQGTRKNKNLKGGGEYQKKEKVALEYPSEVSYCQ